jgi:hypothetical protein
VLLLQCPWDGFGGMLKRVMRRDVIDNKVRLQQL